MHRFLTRFVPTASSSTPLLLLANCNALQFGNYIGPELDEDESDDDTGDAGYDQVRVSSNLWSSPRHLLALCGIFQTCICRERGSRTMMASTLAMGQKMSETWTLVRVCLAVLARHLALAFFRDLKRVAQMRRRTSSRRERWFCTRTRTTTL